MKAPAICTTLLLGISVMASASAQAELQAVQPPPETTVTVRSAGTGYTPSGPAPAFADLDRNGDASLSKDEASSYKLLANDFLKADSDEDGEISKSEYERWAAQP
ncbi:hypothetical protein [Dokdonella sp.]|uniref:hypothetical protein n=1 Tax=Dokdonella sp. TaxID=2291710 RepID=UPI003C4473ED